MAESTEDIEVEINDIKIEDNNENTENTGLNVEDWNGIDTMESLCLSCGENGTTHLLLHKIPYFRELIIASFHCEHCGERNNEVTFGGEIQLKGCVFELKVSDPKDLNRQVIKSDSASLKIPEIDFEVPALTQKGEISTIEGFLQTAAKNLSLFQDQRMEDTPEIGIKVAEIIMQLTMMSNGSSHYLPFTLIVDDPAGNSFIENLIAPLPDPKMKQKFYTRTDSQDISIGLEPEKGTFNDDKESNFQALMNNEKTFGGIDNASRTIEDENSVRLGRSEAISIPAQCPNCQGVVESLTAVTDIPHFKEVIIMAFDCDHCGFRNNEVKAGGAVPTYGSEVILKVLSLDDLKRDVLKSDSSSVAIPELELEVQSGTLGGVYTTIDGLLMKIHKNLTSGNPFAVGDSTTLHHSDQQELKDTKTNFVAFMDNLMCMSQGKILPFTLILRDPLGNSFVSAPLGTFLPPESDENLTIKDFVRSFEENEDYGLNDINTKDFETGVDHTTEIKADRLTHVNVKGEDHPSFYAKGMDDSTPGGAHLGSNNDTDNEPKEYYSLPGYSASKTSTLNNSSVYNSRVNNEEDEVPLPNNYGKRIFNKEDFNLKFIPREEFGSMPIGYVFRLGAQGLGFYEDKYKDVLEN
jgi:zinc finger protein